MAIYHCSVKNITRAKGQSAIAAASYRAGECLYEQSTGRFVACRHDLGGVEHTQIIGYEGRRNDLWNSVEAAEKRKDARTAKEVEVALPAELDHLQRIAAAVDFAEELRKRYQVALDVALHEPKKGKNYHAHILMTTRTVEENKLGKKVRTLDSKQELKAIRKLWQDIANKHLALVGRRERIDCRTLKAQGIDRIPTIHEGYIGHPNKFRNMEINAEIKEINKREALIQKLTREAELHVRKFVTYAARSMQEAAQSLREAAYDGIRQAVKFMIYSFRAMETNKRKRRKRKQTEYIEHINIKNQTNREEEHVYRAL